MNENLPWHLGVNLIDLVIVSGGDLVNGGHFWRSAGGSHGIGEINGLASYYALEGGNSGFLFSWAASFAGIIFEAEFQFIIIVVFAEID